MMRKTRRLAVALAACGLLAAGGVTWSQLAHADNVAGTCYGFGADANCTIEETISNPATISVTVTVSPKQFSSFRWTLQCSLGSQSSTTTGSDAVLTPPQATVYIPLPYTNPNSCDVTLQGDIPTANALDKLYLGLDYTTPGQSTGPSSGPVPLVKGYKGMCLDDKGNSSGNKTKVILWTCNSSDSAQSWTYSNGELQHNGKCANVQGGGGSGSKVILWSCNGASNEKWFHSSTNGEFVLSSQTHGLLCLDDPGYSTTDRTQVIVSDCKNSSNQHWSLS
jgi:hypothetical protein